MSGLIACMPDVEPPLWALTCVDDVRLACMGRRDRPQAVGELTCGGPYRSADRRAFPIVTKAEPSISRD